MTLDLGAGLFAFAAVLVFYGLMSLWAGRQKARYEHRKARGLGR